MISNLFRITAYSMLTIGLLNTLPAQAQEPQTRKLALKEAIDLSIANSKQLKLNQAKINEAIVAVREASDRKLPDVSVTGGGFYLPIQPNISMKSDNSGSGSSGGSDFPSIHQAYYGLVNASLPLFTGGKLKYGVESAQYLEKAAKLDADHDKGEIIYNTINAYANLYKAQLTVELVQQDLQESQQRVKDFTNLEQNGLVARNDLLKVELQSSNVEMSLTEAQTNFKLACVSMNLMLGIPENTSLVADSADLLPADIKSFDEYEQAALQNRKDIQSLAIRKKAAELGVKSAKGEYYPSVALTAGYVALDVPKFISVTNAVDIGLGINYSLSSLWKTKTKVAAAQATVQEITANQALLDDNIRLQIHQAYEFYLLSQRKISLSEKAIEDATENYRITKNKYDNALETTTNLLDADVAKLQANLNYYTAKADALVAYNKLLQAAGLLNNQ